MLRTQLCTSSEFMFSATLIRDRRNNKKPAGLDEAFIPHDALFEPTAATIQQKHVTDLETHVGVEQPDGRARHRVVLRQGDAPMVEAAFERRVLCAQEGEVPLEHVPHRLVLMVQAGRGKHTGAA